MENAHIADIFEQIADLLELGKENAFRIRSYRNAALTVRNFSKRFEDMVQAGENLKDLPNIGESTAEKIIEIVNTGTCQRIEELKKEVPAGLIDLMKIPGLGPRKAMQLFKELKIDSTEKLAKACQDHKVRDLEGFGEKTETKILEGIQTVQTTAGRILLKEAADHIEALGRHLDSIKAIDQWQAAGSFRRQKETIGDLDILVRTIDRKKAAEAILKYKPIAKTIGHGEEKISVTLEDGLQVDFRFVDEKSFGAALMYFTGSKPHNIALRKLAQEKKWKLSEYGLFAGEKLLAGADEQSVYKKLGLDWIPPEMREDRGEIDMAMKGKLPTLVELADIQGDLHSHTDATDGTSTLEEMAEAARAKGYSYLAVTDHSKAVHVAGGLNDKEMLKELEKIQKLAATLKKKKGFHLLAGIEVDILKTGALDLADDTLAQLDWVTASIHYNRNLSKDQMTDRIIAAVSSGLVHCLGHPLGRIIGRRDPLVFDEQKVFAACKKHNVAIEIDAQPDRMDLPDTLCQAAKAAGLKFVITTDAHKPSDMEFMALGVAVARRGWLEKKDVLNTLAADELEKAIKKR